MLITICWETCMCNCWQHFFTHNIFIVYQKDLNLFSWQVQGAIMFWKLVYWLRRMSSQANKSDIEFYCSNKISHNVIQKGVYFQIWVEKFGNYCRLLSGFSGKFAHHNFIDMRYIWGHCGRSIMKIRNPFHRFLVVIVKVLRSYFKA